MANVDIDPFGHHNNAETQPDETGETIPLTTRGVGRGGDTWEPE